MAALVLVTYKSAGSDAKIQTMLKNKFYCVWEYLQLIQK